MTWSLLDGNNFSGGSAVLLLHIFETGEHRLEGISYLGTSNFVYIFPVSAMGNGSFSLFGSSKECDVSLHHYNNN